MKLRGCPHCGGDIWIDEPELHVFEEVCLLCSRRRELTAAPTPAVAWGETVQEKRSRFFREHRVEMLEAYGTMEPRAFYDRYDLAKGTWYALRKRWADEAVTA